MSASSSGVRIIPLVLSQITVLIITGAIVTRWGYYVCLLSFPHHQKLKLRIKQVPYMIVGQIICAIGAGLLTRLGLNTPAVKWVSYLVVTGFGMGMSMQLPYTAVQVALRYMAVLRKNGTRVTDSSPRSEADAPTGNGMSL